MKSILRTIAREATNNAFGDSLKDAMSDAIREALRVHPPHLKRPMSSSGCFSDLFPWRSDAVWQTKIDVMNIPSLILPQNPPDDDVLIVVYDLAGKELARQAFHLEPFCVRSILIGDLIDETAGVGTFLCFHQPTKGHKELAAFGGYLVDRQYIAVKRREDPFWSYVHGNYHGIFMYPDGKIVSQVSRPTQRHYYKPQLRFDDCDRSELVYCNSAPYPIDINLIMRGNSQEVTKEVSTTIAPNGLSIIELDNVARKHVTVEADSNTLFLRPVIFKYYETHFNVLHS